MRYLLPTISRRTEAEKRTVTSTPQLVDGDDHTGDLLALGTNGARRRRTSQSRKPGRSQKLPTWNSTDLVDLPSRGDQTPKMSPLVCQSITRMLANVSNNDLTKLLNTVSKVDSRTHRTLRLDNNMRVHYCFSRRIHLLWHIKNALCRVLPRTLYNV